MPVDNALNELEAQHARLLTWSHYAVAVLTALATLILGVVVVLAGQALVDTPPPPGDLAEFGSEEAALVGVVVVIAGVCFLAVGLAHAAIVAWVGCLIARRRRWMLCMIFSVGHLIFFPLGTVLSVYAIVVLRWPGVRQAFRR